MPRIRLDGWSLIPGPLKNPPASSIDLHDVAEYPPQLVAEMVLAFPGMRLMRDAQPSWWDWKARWQSGGGFFEVEMSQFETDPPAWGGSGVVADCELADFLEFCRHVRNRLPAVWLHNADCEIHSPESFAALFSHGSGVTGP